VPFLMASSEDGKRKRRGGLLSVGLGGRTEGCGKKENEQLQLEGTVEGGFVKSKGGREKTFNDNDAGFELERFEGEGRKGGRPL